MAYNPKELKIYIHTKTCMWMFIAEFKNNWRTETIQTPINWWTGRTCYFFATLIINRFHLVLEMSNICHGFSGSSGSKESACNAGDLGLIHVLGRSPGGRHGNLLQYSYLENSMDNGDWQATVHGGPKSWTRLKWLSMHAIFIPVSLKTSIIPCLQIHFLWVGI